MLLLLLTACGGGDPADKADGAVDSGDAPYILPAAEADPPPFDAAAVTAELEAAAARFVTYDAQPLLDAYVDLVAAGADGDCPTFGVTDDLVYWADACTASTGTRFDGYGYYVDAAAALGADGARYTGGAVYGVATIEDAAGQRFIAAGGAGQYEGDDEAGRHFSYLQLDDGFALEGAAAAGTWLAAEGSPELILSGGESLSEGVRYLMVRGRLSGEAFDAVIFDDLLSVSGEVPGACTIEPAGTASLLDGEGHWLDVLFDGTNLEGQGGDPSRCDGCGGVWFAGQYLGEVCPDLGALTAWSGAPWG